MNDVAVIKKDQIPEFVIRMIYRGLQMQAKTGLKMTNKTSTLQAARNYGFEGRTCKALLKDMEAKCPFLKN